MKPVSSYHPLLVALHWLVALLIVGELALGILASTAADAQRVALLRWHFPVGVLIALLMLARLAVRLLTAAPPSVDAYAPLQHFAFYAIVLLTAGAGFAMAVQYDLGKIVFGPPGEAFPADLASLPAFVVHASLAALLAAAIVVHVVFAVVRRMRGEGYLRRMSFTRPAA